MNSNAKDTQRRRKVSFNSYYFEQASRSGKSFSMSETFAHINEVNLWGAKESESGEGSTAEQTGILVDQLPKLFSKFGIRSIVDAPCGDLNWILPCLESIDRYVGCDILPDLIEQNMKNCGSLSKAVFLCTDISHEFLPQVDLILCRDCLVHFSYADIVRTIDNFKSSHSKYLLTTTFTACISNTDINTGDWRPINLEIGPLSFGKPIQTVVEHCSESQGAFRDKSLGLWDISKI
jgi:hypothetical protein